MAACVPMRSDPSWRAGAEAGFTLIEIMVALAVFSLAVLALVRLESATIRGATILDETMVAGLVARNVAIEAVTDPTPPARGVSNGVEENGGRRWAWSRNVQATGNAAIVRIDVAVADPSGAVIGRASMVRPASTDEAMPAAPGNSTGASRP